MIIAKWTHYQHIMIFTYTVQDQDRMPHIARTDQQVLMWICNQQRPHHPKRLGHSGVRKTWTIPAYPMEIIIVDPLSYNDMRTGPGYRTFWMWVLCVNHINVNVLKGLCTRSHTAMPRVFPTRVFVAQYHAEDVVWYTRHDVQLLLYEPNINQVQMNA